MVPIAAMSTRQSATAVASRHPLLNHPMNANTATTKNHGSHSRNCFSGSMIFVTRKSLMAFVPPITGTPLRRLSSTHFTALSMGVAMS